MAGWVLGCHRSGTSLLCRILREASRRDHHALLGDDITLRHDNPLGHAESAALMGVNEELLALAGATWDRPFLVRPRWEAPEAIERLRTLTERLPGHIAEHQWIDKDPRLCLTRDALVHVMLADLPAIAILRHPLEVAQSLFQRDGFSLRRSAAIWLVYNYHLFHCSSRPPSTTVLLGELGNPQAHPALAAKLDGFLEEALGYDGEAWAGTASLLARHFQHRQLRSGHTSIVAEDPQLASQLGDLWERIAKDVHDREAAGLNDLFCSALQEFEPFVLQELAPPLPLLMQSELRKELLAAQQSLEDTRESLRKAEEKSHLAAMEISRLRNSTSWKLTAPVRKVADYWKRMHQNRKGS